MKRGRYSNNACKNCRKKSTKCDERVPTCSKCEQLNLSCEYTRKIIIYQPDKPKKKKRTQTVKIEVPKENNFYIIDEIVKQIRLDLKQRTTKSNHCVEIDCLEIPENVKDWRQYREDRYLLLSTTLDANGSQTFKSYNHDQFHENNRDVLEFIFHTFTESKAVYNFVLVTDDYNNCLTKWVLYFSKKYPIIGLTINSITSNLLDVRCADDRWMCILQRNMSATLSNISKRVGACESFPEMACYLLCIMFLFSERSATRLDAWRLHLRGAFAILEKCDSLYNDLLPLVRFDPEISLATEMYSWAKNWFIDAEIKACMSAPKGGAIRNIELVNKYLRFHGKQTDGFLIGEFNLVKGYSQSLTPVFIDIIEYIMEHNTTGELLSGSEGILRSAAVTTKDRSLGEALLKQISGVETEILDFSSIKDYQKRATMRACNVCFCSAVRIFVYSVILGESIYGNLVQHYVQIIEEQLVSIKYIAIYGLCIHWPLFVAALCSRNGQRNSFMTSIQAISNNGTYVARNTAERIQNFWNIIDNGGVVNEEDYDCITL